MSTGPVLAIDVGTSSIRVAVVDQDTVVLDDVRVGRVDDSPGHTFDADRLWAAVSAAIGALAPAARSACGVVSVAAHLGTVLLDDRLRTVGPASGWSDQRGVDALAAALGDERDALLRATGRPMVSAGPLARLLDARPGRGSPDATSGQRIAIAVSPKDFIVARLGSVTVADVTTDPTSAGYTGAYDLAAGDWSRDVLGRVGIEPAALGRLVASPGVVATLRDDVAAATGLPTGIPIVSGGPDGTVGLAYLLGGAPVTAVSSAGVGIPIGDVAGTTDVLAVRRAGIEADHDAVVNPYPFGGFTVGGPTGTTGGAVAHWARLLGFRDTADALRSLGAQIADIAPGSDGLRASVALSGSRFPQWDPSATGSLVGLTDAHGPAHVLRAVLEGGASAVAEALAAMPVDDTAPVVLAGGAARSMTVVRVRAQVLGRSVLACDEPDVTLMGAALIGLLGTASADEHPALLQRFAPHGTVVDPDRPTSERLVLA